MPPADPLTVPANKQRALKALAILGPRLKLAVQEAQLGTYIEKELRIDSHWEAKDRFQFAGKEKPDVTLFAVLAPVSALKCFQIELHLQLPSSLGSHRFLDSSLFDRVNKRTLMDVMKGSLEKLKLFVSKWPAEERLLTSELTNELLKPYRIVPLEEMSKRFPQAILYCEMCDYHAVSLKMAVSHKGGPEHRCHERISHFRQRLQKQPQPSSAQATAVLELFKEVLADSPPYDKEIEQLRKNLEGLLRREFKGSQVFLYGSHLAKHGRSSSDINLSATIGDVGKTYALFSYLLERIHELEGAENPKLLGDYYIPCLQFTFSPKADTQVTVHLTVNDYNSILYDNLIAVYSSLKPEFPALLKVVRHWAQVAKITDPSWKAIQKHAIDLMLVHFLQQRKLLPVAHEVAIKGRKVTPMDEWEAAQPLYQNNVKILKSLTNTSQKWNIGKRFIDFLRFYACEFNEEHAIQITQKDPMLRADLDWGRKFITMKDPFRKGNVFHMAKEVYVFAQNAFIKSFLYFGTARFSDGSAAMDFTLMSSLEQRPERKKKAKQNPEPTTSKDDSENLDESFENSHSASLSDQEDDVFDASVPEVDELHEPANLVYSRHFVTSLKKQAETPFNARLRQLDILDNPERYKAWTAKKAHEASLSMNAYDFIFHVISSMKIAKKKDWSSGMKGADPSEFKYSLDFENLSHKSLHFVCALCSEEGHLDQVCTKWRSQDTSAYGGLDEERRQCLSKIIRETHSKLRLASVDLEEYEYVKAELQKRIKKVYPHAVLSEFGSVASGFGTRACDFDLCFRFEGQKELPEDVNVVAIINRISEVLKAPEFISVHVVSNARVPIVKFKHYLLLEGDVSVYNSLALVNTDLLRTYCTYDKRVAPLGIAVKRWAKACGINEPATGSMSSYALIIMVLHYLQRTSPPVLPVLQEAVYTDQQTPLVIDGFATNFSRHAELLGGFSYPNRSSLADLFVGFFDYFIRDFDWCTHVVHIRSTAPILKLEKSWCEDLRKPFCIEDPFNLTHNLTAGVSRKMAKHILDTMNLTRKSLRTCNMTAEMSLIDADGDLLRGCRLLDDPPSSSRRPEMKKKPQKASVGAPTPKKEQKKEPEPVSEERDDSKSGRRDSKKGSKAERNRMKKLVRSMGNCLRAS
uniref:RNA uridylyltransferase n=1 Tax=Steinernema glaseri TaxID=37863 RepID=A0A1I8AVQ2_9BILA